MDIVVLGLLAIAIPSIGSSIASAANPNVGNAVFSGWNVGATPRICQSDGAGGWTKCQALENPDHEADPVLSTYAVLAPIPTDTSGYDQITRSAPDLVSRGLPQPTENGLLLVVTEVAEATIATLASGDLATEATHLRRNRATDLGDLSRVRPGRSHLGNDRTRWHALGCEH